MRVPVDADEVDRLRVVGVKLVVNLEGGDCEERTERFSIKSSERGETKDLQLGVNHICERKLRS